MQLGQQLASLKLEQSFVKELNNEDIDFAQKQYQKLYAEEMSKLSFKLEKIERVKRNLLEIEQEQNSKLKDMKESLNKKYEFIEKNKQKYLTQKLKSYKIHHEVWENKMTSIKRKNREYMRAHADKSQKYANQVEQFWKTKTQQIFASSFNHLETQKKKPISPSKKQDKRESIKMHTEGSQRKKSVLLKKEQHFSRQNTQNNEISERNNNHSRRETKSIRFTIESHKDHNLSNLSQDKRNNESKVSQKFSIHSLRNTQNNNESKKSIKMPYLDQNRFSNQLMSQKKMNITHNNMGSRKSLQQEGPQGYRLSIRNEMLKQQNNFSFQKAMKKLDKIHKIKLKNMKKLQPSQKALSPSKPRKSIDAQQYRLLRVKSQVKKSKQKLNTQQNIQTIQQSPTKDIFTATRIIRNRTVDSQQRYHNVKNIKESRMSIVESRMKQEQQRSKERTMTIQNENKRWKKERIVKAIKDRIFKIKLQEMQKIKDKQLL